MGEKHRMKIKIIGIFVCILLVAVSISSAISTDIKTSISNYKSREDCGCNKLSDADLDNIEKQFDRFEKCSKSLLGLSKDKTVVLDYYEEISDMISKLNKSEKRPICNFLYNLREKYGNIHDIFLGLAFMFIYYFPSLILTAICINLAGIYFILYNIADNLYNILNCP